MREIKFRAWNENIRKMMLWDDIKRLGNIGKLLTLAHVEVMQYTGLKDKNGKDIYEGDVMTGNLEVIFEEGGFAFRNPTSSGADKLHSGRVSRLEVNGNIYEHHHLITKI